MEINTCPNTVVLLLLCWCVPNSSDVVRIVDSGTTYYVFPSVCEVFPCSHSIFLHVSSTHSPFPLSPSLYFSFLIFFYFYIFDKFTVSFNLIANSNSILHYHIHVHSQKLHYFLSIILVHESLPWLSIILSISPKYHHHLLCWKLHLIFKWYNNKYKVSNWWNLTMINSTQNV